MPHDVSPAFALDEAIAVLERTPRVLRTLLEGLPDAWVQCDEGPDTWTPQQVVAHLANADRTVWMVRARSILDSTEAVPFPAFDRDAHLHDAAGHTLAGSLDAFDAARHDALRELRALHEAGALHEGALDRTGIHPAFGVVTLRQLLSTWVTHDFTHLAQITRTLAHRYEHAVGPWRAYLSVLTR